MARLKLHVTPVSREDDIIGWQGDSLRIKVRARREKGRANQAVLHLLARRLSLPLSRISIVHGAGSRDKLMQVEGLSEDELLKRLGLAHHVSASPGAPRPRAQGQR